MFSELHALLTYRDTHRSHAAPETAQATFPVAIVLLPPFDLNLLLLNRGILESDLHTLVELLGVQNYEQREDQEGLAWNYIAGHKRCRVGAEAIYMNYRVQTDGSSQKVREIPL